ncbi:MAG: hypothetical protein QF907_02710 [Nitrospinota bacterium]|nr:hypothetical protein [Nitrospinota bacterium]MDP7555826.1 hypothetical protein [Nitrospinota bacterium]HJN02293.1 hypothetical protein [Nitrospinota bacterium]|tara:strand:+ start:83 stop:205 length:123 start_codon:yes stop_codon:yes gene_type:complete
MKTKGIDLMIGRINICSATLKYPTWYLVYPYPLSNILEGK